MPRRLNIVCGLFLAAATLPLPAGCKQPENTLARVQDQLTIQQRDNDRLRKQVNDQAEQLAGLKGQLATLNKLPADRWDLIPRAERIEIDRFSAVRPGKPQLSGTPATQPAGGGATVDLYARIYLIAIDDNGWRLRVAGTMKISMFDLSGDQPRPVGVYEFSPAELARHYLSAMSAELFAFDLPLTALPRGGVTVHVELTDLLSAKVLTAEKRLDLPKK